MDEDAKTIQVSYSEIKDFRRCPAKHNVGWKLGWRKQERHAHHPLTFGTAWHAILAEYYSRGEDAVPAAIQDQPEELHRDLTWMFEGYYDTYHEKEKRWGVVAVEKELIIPLPPQNTGLHVNLKVIIDLVIRDPHGNLWIDDHKCLRSSTPIVTALGGHTSIGDVREGDRVLGSDGTWTKVTRVTKRRLPGYRITLRNRKTIDCTAEHRWPVERTRNTGRYRREELTTEDLMIGLKEGHEYRLLHAPATKFPERTFPLDPYALGALLGDGGLTGGSVTFHKNHIPTIERLHARLPATIAMVERKTDRVRTFGLRGANQIMRGLGLMGCHGRDKFIPDEYLIGSLDQRWALLHGLMDTDGSNRKGVPLYTTASEKLATDVATLVESLGGVATLWCNRKTGADPSWEVKMRFERDERAPFLHEEKLSRWKPSGRTLNERYVIEDISAIGGIDCTDLAVAADDSLFTVAGVLTHNSCAQFPREDRRVDPQLPLYCFAWAYSTGERPIGARYSYSRKPPRKQETRDNWTLESRFSRSLKEFSRAEIITSAQDAYKTAYDMYGRTPWPEPARHISPDCSWDCDYRDACEISRRRGSGVAGMQDHLNMTGFARRSNETKEAK